MEEEKQKRCFVVGPIGSTGSETRNNADMLLAYIIRPALEKIGYAVDRADDEKSPGNISDHVINSVLDADLVVADLTGPNANAFYELGIRHMIEKPVIHMILDGEKPPFDVNNFNTIFYKLENPEDHKKAASLLMQHAEATEGVDFSVSNPITAARGHQKLALSADPMQKTVSTLMSEVAELKRFVELNSGVPSIDTVRGLRGGAFTTSYHGQLSDIIGKAEALGIGKKGLGPYLRNTLTRKATPQEINDLLSSAEKHPDLTAGDMEDIIREVTRDY